MQILRVTDILKFKTSNGDTYTISTTVGGLEILLHSGNEICTDDKRLTTDERGMRNVVTIVKQSFHHRNCEHIGCASCKKVLNCRVNCNPGYTKYERVLNCENCEHVKCEHNPNRERK